MAKGTQAALAKHLDLTIRSIQEMVQRGIFPRSAPGQVDIDECRVAYIRHLRGVAAGHRSEDGKLDLTAENARLAKERADQIAMQNAVARTELLPRGEVEGAIVAVLSNMRTRLLAIPSKAAPKLVGETSKPVVHAELEKLVNEALKEISSVRISPKAEIEYLGNGGGLDDGLSDGPAAAAETDGQRVGRPKQKAKSRGKRRNG